MRNRNMPNTPTEQVRADEVRLTDFVWFQNWDMSWQRGRVGTMGWSGEDVEVCFVDEVTGTTVRFSTSPSNRVRVNMR